MFGYYDIYSQVCLFILYIIIFCQKDIPIDYLNVMTILNIPTYYIMSEIYLKVLYTMYYNI